ncbi:MAG TPA: DUF6691 family protein [Thiohalobacter sp.]|nr:DUF6691 family protein [Thiohalobacter sp.]
MLGHVTVFLAGLLFALGLGISGMTLPQKVVGFLDFAGGDWDPSLGLVMITSAGVYLLLYPLVRRRTRPRFDARFHVPTRNDIDRPLVAGALLFGVGWGLVGLCPGPAVLAVMSGQPPTFAFFVAMLLGMYAEGSTLRRFSRLRAGASAESADG